MKTEAHVIYIAHDGTKFTSEEECRKYERAHPLSPIYEALRKAEYNLKITQAAISRHKGHLYAGFNMKYACIAGEYHRRSLVVWKKLMKAGKKKDESTFQFFARAGAAANDVITYKEHEKTAVKELRQLREKRANLRAEIVLLRANKRAIERKEPK